MKKKILVAAVASSLLLGGCASTADSLNPNKVTMNKQMVSMERAVVLMGDSVMARPSQMNKATRNAGIGMLAAGASVGAVGGYNGSNGTAAAGAAVALVGLGMLIAGEISDQEVPAYRYTIEMQEGGMTEVIQTVPEHGTPLVQNQAIFLKNYSDGSSYIFPDTTQGVVFKRADDTAYTGDKEKIAAAEKIAAEKSTKEAEYQEWILEQEKRRIEAETKKQETMSDKTSDIIDANNEAVVNSSKKESTVVFH